MILINMGMPTSCDNCWALDDYGDYPRCRITEEQRGYNFRIREKRMDKCPLIPVPDHGRPTNLDELLKDGWVLIKSETGTNYSRCHTIPLNCPSLSTIVPADKEGDA